MAVAFLLAACGTGGLPSATADQENGHKLFQSKCGGCHALSAAGTSGQIGPNLDDAFAQAADTLGRTAVAVQAYKHLLDFHLDPSTKAQIRARIETLQQSRLPSGGG